MLLISIPISLMLACCFLNNYKKTSSADIEEHSLLILPLDLLSSGHLLNLHRAHGTRTAAPPLHSFL